MYSQDQPSSLSKPSDTTASGDSFLLLLICLYLELESQIKTPRSYLELLFATHQMIELQDFVYLSPYLDIWSICMWFFGNRKLGFLLLQICQQSVFIAPLSGDIFDLDMLWFQKTWFFLDLLMDVMVLGMVENLTLNPRTLIFSIYLRIPCFLFPHFLTCLNSLKIDH